MPNWLSEENNLLGQVERSGIKQPARVVLKQDLSVIVYLPYDASDNDPPNSVESQIADWKLRIESGAGSFTFRHDRFKETLRLSTEEAAFFSSSNLSGLWTEITYRPERLIFTRADDLLPVPDEWGITYYPSKSNTSLFYLFGEVLRNPRRLPNFFSTIDRSTYFKNYANWSLDEIEKRLPLLASCLALYAGMPITCELLVGRFNRDAIVIRIDNILNPNEFVCSSRYNAHIDITDEFIPYFPSFLVNRIEEITKINGSEKCSVIFAYVRMILMAHYDEAKIAFSFQLMESLMKFTGGHIAGQLRNIMIQKIMKQASGKLCLTCSNVLKEKIKTEKKDDLIGYIGQALDSVNNKEQFEIDPAAIKKIASWYRNELFHGSFFEDMAQIDEQLKDLPDGYKRDLPLVFQAIAFIIANHLVLGVDFKCMSAYKRELV